MNKVLLAALVLCVVIPITASAGVGTDPSSYMQCDWTREDYIPTDGLVADWQFLDAVVEGDLLQGAGDMESGVVSGGCTYCPTGSSYCLCQGTSNVTQEVSKIYKTNSSLKFSTDALDSYIAIGYAFWAAPNSAYQISYKVKGEAGGESFSFAAVAVGPLYYNFTTDVWQAGAAPININPTTAWTTNNFYLVNDAALRLVSIYLTRNIANEIYYFDDFQIRKLKSTGPRSRAGQYTLSVPVTSDMRFGDSPNLLSKPADGPAGSWGTSFDGVDDYLYINDAAWQEPQTYGGDWSFACKYTKESATDIYLINKYGLAANNAFRMFTSGGELYCSVVDCADTISSRSSGIVPANGTLNGQICAYKQILTGSSVLTNYTNNTANSMATAIAPICNGNQPVRFSASGYGVAGSTRILQCSLYGKTLDAIEANKYINPYFPGNNNNRGSYVTTCTQAASHATCSATKCRDGTPNACQAEATGAEAVFGQQTELVPYNSFEIVVGDDSNPAITGWTIVNITGDGTATTTIYRDETKHGNIAVRMKSSGSTAANISTSNCIPVTPLATYYPYLSGKQLGGSRSNLYLNVNSYSDGACANYVSAASVRTSSISSVFEVLKPFVFPNGVTVGVGTNSVTLQVVNYGSYAGAAPPFTGTASSDILIDAVSFKAGTYFTPWTHNPGAGTTTYNARDYRIRNTLADQTYSGTYPYLTGWCGAAWVYTDYNGSQIVGNYTLAVVPATAGANNFWYIHLENGNYIAFYLNDGAGGSRVLYQATDATNWTGSNWHYVEWCSNNNNTLTGHWYNVSNSTWYTIGVNGGGGIGIQNGQSTTMSIGTNAGASPLNGYISQLCFKPYNAIYPNCGFNGGKPPFLAATYPPLPI